VLIIRNASSSIKNDHKSADPINRIGVLKKWTIAATIPAAAGIGRPIKYLFETDSGGFLA
jgi:hypothetical protein